MASYVCDTFSFNMIPHELMWRVRLSHLKMTQAPASFFGGYRSRMTDDNLARVLGLSINRGWFVLNETDQLVIVRYHGPRIPDHLPNLPKGGEMEFILLKFFQGDTEK